MENAIAKQGRRIIRVFPRRTTATPDDSLVRYSAPTHPLFDEADEVHVSVAFTWDIPRAEALEKSWRFVTQHTDIGGPAITRTPGDFSPGMYVRKGNVITSRGCPNRCWFCRAWKIEGNEIIELSIHDGWNVLDNNLLACTPKHQGRVFEMLLRQKKRPRFSGGLEAARLTDWHLDWLSRLRPEYMYFAYDEARDYEPLMNAAHRLRTAGLMKNNKVGCYVLVGYRGDTFENAEKRLVDTAKLGYFPQAMFYDRGEWMSSEGTKRAWRRFQRSWANKIIVGAKVKKYAHP